MSIWDQDNRPASDEPYDTETPHGSPSDDQIAVGSAHHEGDDHVELTDSFGHDHEHGTHEHGEMIHADEVTIESHSHEKGGHSTEHNKEDHHHS